MKNNKRRRWYALSVLAYYRAEWTDISDEDSDYRLFVTKELQNLIDGCMRRKTSIPNAAKEVHIFLNLSDEIDVKTSTNDADLGNSEADA